MLNEKSLNKLYDDKSNNITSLHLKESTCFRNIINVPSDGWCLLYSFQMAYLVDYSSEISLNNIRIKILNEFKKLCTSNSNRSSSNYFENFLAEESSQHRLFESSQDETQALLVKSIYDNLKSKSAIQIQKFHLIRYLENKVFNASITDYIPKLLADAFQCTINIHIVEDQVLKKLISFECNQQSNSRINNQLNILFWPHKRHYMTLTQKQIQDKKLNQFFKSKYCKQPVSLLDILKKNSFYSDVANRFETSKKIKNKISIMLYFSKF